MFNKNSPQKLNLNLRHLLPSYTWKIFCRPTEKQK